VEPPAAALSYTAGSVRFAKYQALGNDYLVVRARDLPAPLRPEAARRLCDRHLGVGADGVLLAGEREADGSFGLRILNPDGSQAEKSGNGLRIFARWLWDHGLVDDAPFRVRLAVGAVRCRVAKAGERIEVEMGRASFHSRDVPVLGPPREVLEEPVGFGDRACTFSAVTLGNPHCVVLSPRADADAVRALGPRLERDPRFPNRTNVQLAQVVDRGRLRAEIWERGAGYTLASGSSACAVAAVCRRLDLCDAEVQVEMPGGVLDVAVDPGFALRMTGPAHPVFEGELPDGAPA